MEADAAAAMRAALEARDATDPLGPLRDAFLIREGLIYLDGNSLGPLQRCVLRRLDACQRKEWGEDLISSWNTADWVSLPRTVGARIAPLIGAGKDDVVVTDSTSVNLFKVLAAAVQARPERRVIVSERSNFPTDLYIAEGLAAFAGRAHELRLIEAPEELDAALGDDVAAVMLTHVNYRTGRMFDMGAITDKIHAAGALAIWDLAHSAGAVPVDLAGAGADFAIGCGYKYLNGGPGAPAFLYASPEMQAATVQPLSGWFGHAAPFAFDHAYRPAAGIDRFLTGTPPVLSLVALDEALKIWERVSIEAVRQKSVALTELFIRRVEAECAGHPIVLATPREAADRGSQVSFSHPDAFAVMQALIARGVVGDFRAPDILRFGFTPLYTRYVDVFDAARHLKAVLDREEWRSPQFSVRGAVT
ncbi:MAG: kynureninase [Pararhizobium sp.]